MEDAVHEGDSNSQSASTISQCRRGANGRVRIVLSDGSFFFVSESFFNERAIRSGISVSEELLAGMADASAYISALDKSGEFLARRDHSVVELSRKLRSRGFAQPTIDLVVDKLQVAGHLDDTRFAEAWVRSRLRRHPEGHSRLIAGLYRRGVGRIVIMEAVRAVFTDETAEDAISRAAAKILRGGVMDTDTLLRKLTSRGFTYRQVQIYLQKVK